MHKIVVRVNAYVCSLFVCKNMIRTLAYSHAEYEVYITPRNSRVVYTEVLYLLSASIFNNLL